MQEIIDNSDLRRYRTELPNMADDDLDPYQYRLYAHYKRWCGANGGHCNESVRQTAKVCRMSATKVIDTRQWLHENGWIELSQNPITGAYTIQITDRWPENFARYASKSVPNMEQSPKKRRKSVPNMEQLPESGAESVPNMEQSVPNMEQGVPNMEHKKELLEVTIERTEEEYAATPPTAAAETSASVEEQKPQPPSQPEPVTAKSLAQQTVVVMYRDAFLRFPSKAQMAWLVAQEITDLRRWMDVITLWVGRGWSPTNLSGMVDLYRNPTRIQELRTYRPAAPQPAPPPKPKERLAPGFEEWMAELSQIGVSA